MGQYCHYPHCGRKLSINYRGQTNQVHENYCTLYCRDALIRGMRPIKTSTSHGKKFLPLTRECSVCKRDYTLTHDEHRGNQRFCSQDCYRVITSFKKGHRDFLILTILAERGAMTSAELARISGAFWKSATLRSIGLIMKAWVGRGVVTAVRPQPKRPYTYTMNTKLSPGELIMKYCRKK